jgi:glutamate:Na+ symporter, ESS family
MITTIETPGFLTFTISTIVFFVGSGLNRCIAPLRRWNIPDAVTGGILASLVTLIAYRIFGLAITFDLDTRDLLLLFFFTGIGLNARLSDLLTGGRPFFILLALTISFLVIQNLIAAGSVAALGLPQGLTVLLGSASLIGGHGTTIAWAPLIRDRFGVTNAMEVGIAAATLGLVVASVIGGPVASFLISRNALKGSTTEAPAVGLADIPDEPSNNDLNHVAVLRTLLTLSIAILLGFVVDDLLADTGIKLPLFVSCMIIAILLTNTVPNLLPRLRWPTRTPALALISDLSLNVFLAMSLMSMQLWTLGGLGPVLILVLAAQTVATVVYILFVVFPAMGRDYLAAVIASGFSGIALGATPTAIANMTAVSKVHGAAPTAFIILPLVSAFFIDIANAVAIGFFVR